MSPRKVLWISKYAPYDKVGHAGGQIENFYTKKLNALDNFELLLVSFCEERERETVIEDSKKYCMNTILVNESQVTFGERCIRKLCALQCKYNVFDQYGGFVSRFIGYEIKRCLKTVNFEPDIVILQWTQIVLFIKQLRKMFPNARFIAVEEDVTYLSFLRKIALKQGFDKLTSMIRYQQIRKTELRALQAADKTVVNNPKDLKLIEEDNITNGFLWVPFFYNYSSVVRKTLGKDILFYGAMYRYENYASAIWFIENVFDKIEDKEVRFIIVGNRPDEALLRYQSERIIITGFVESVAPYFEKCACMVAPLILGAGVKIKILEAMSSGIPVLTNKIGIEGIPAENEQDYFHCEKPEEYVQIINTKMGQDSFEKVGQNGQNLILKNYDYESSFKGFVSMLEEL